MITKLNPLIRKFYLTGLNEALWQQWLSELTELLPCSSMALAVVEQEAKFPVLLCCHGGLSADARPNLSAFIQRVDEGLPCAERHGPAGWFCEPSTPYGLWLWTDEALWHSPELELLWPHLCQWSKVLYGHGRERPYLLMPSHIGAIICSSQGQIRFCNQDAERLIGEVDSLPEPLAVLFREVMAGGCSYWSSARLSGRELQILVYPPQQEEVLVLLRQPDQGRAFSADYFMALYELSRKEALVAVELAQGYLPQQIARRLHVGESTIRTHIRKILQKSGSRNLNQLMVKVHVGLNGLEWSALHRRREMPDAQAQ
ncbi:helix-turn-helix transcriptional regulator [Ferrimonas futtsuensis]|uniref:helix-turn-helix transcriptional regulator n=1 Tax=Ferrimonas futtsuensis TaxID=364764 RepID=UPI00040C5014|nr:LuxR C-terminal-related transcriptional regulator [Ferrimonas futtsuensis]